MRLLFLIVVSCLLAWGYSATRTATAEAIHLREISLEETASGLVGPTDKKVRLPIVVGGGERRALELDFRSGGQSITLDVVIETSGGHFELLGRDGVARQLDCHTIRPGLESCISRVRLTASDARLFLMAPATVTIQSIEGSLLVAKREAQTGKIPVIALGLLALFGPFFWFRSARFSYLAVCAIASAWMILVDVRFFLLTAVGLVSFYVTLLALQRRDRKGFWFLAVLFGAITVLLLVKTVMPLAAGFFANPGALFLLPLGFSYFMIRIIDLAFKTYARQIERLSLLEYLAYMMFPPTLAAGPVMSLPQFRNGRGVFSTLEDRTEGLIRICIGVGKKLAADSVLFFVISPGTGRDFFGPSNGDVPVVLLANVAFVFLDFSAYSDIAIGVARWWGWKVPENFNWPLVRRNMREFWQNWHMSLTQWVTRHVFVQAGMEVRRSPKWMQTVLPAFATMLTIGLWHGLELVWVLWAVHHTGGILIGDRVVRWGGSEQGAKTLSGVRRAIGARLTNGVITACGVTFVWCWVALSAAFITTSSVREALDNYIGFLSLGAGGLPTL
jgi:D-alanyl-lipoteichoic acid acyltransferase DltB (MBOAT superfamily)